MWIIEMLEIKLCPWQNGCLKSLGCGCLWLKWQNNGFPRTHTHAHTLIMLVAMAELLNSFGGTVFFCMTRCRWLKTYLPRSFRVEGYKHHLKQKYDSGNTHEGEPLCYCSREGGENKTPRTKRKWDRKKEETRRTRHVYVLPRERF